MSIMYKYCQNLVNNVYISNIQNTVRTRSDLVHQNKYNSWRTIATKEMSDEMISVYS